MKSGLPYLLASGLVLLAAGELPRAAAGPITYPRLEDTVGPLGVSHDCFREGWQGSFYGVYATPDSDYDSGLGVGLGADYFFTRHLGLGVNGTWVDVQLDPSGDTIVHNYMIDLTWRLPLTLTPAVSVAPYALVGVGAFVSENHSALLGRVGAGLDLRFAAMNHGGVFADWLYQLPGGGGGDDDLEDHQMVRAGIRIPF